MDGHGFFFTTIILRWTALCKDIGKNLNFEFKNVVFGFFLLNGEFFDHLDINRAEFSTNSPSDLLWIYLTLRWMSNIMIWRKSRNGFIFKLFHIYSAQMKNMRRTWSRSWSRGCWCVTPTISRTTNRPGITAAT